ncbi:MAG: hypothetical protein CVV44_21405 [Spirochaetae bacterium HGW-Spirochaetae-1]|nr:MAG: hypothetical protein CVV44_21405 [Spirochaetae bacterium HGW-Spirochaetae-1]
MYFGIEKQYTTGGTEIEESHCAVNNVYLNGVRVAVVAPSGQALYYLTDQVDSVKVVVNDSGLPIKRFEYLPYGETWFEEGEGSHAPKYNSQELDLETGYYFYNARHYDPEINRFVTADNVIDGEYDTQGWNRYMYCHGNPVMYLDPTGHGILDIFRSGGEALNEAGTKLNKAVNNLIHGEQKGTEAEINPIKNEMLKNYNSKTKSTRIGNTKINMAQVTDPEKAINGMNNKTLDVLGDMTKKFELTSMTISSLARKPLSDDPKKDPHRYEEYDNAGGGRGVDITDVTSKKYGYARLQGKTDSDPKFEQKNESSLTEKITDYLRDDKRVKQVITPWRVIDKYNQRDPERPNEIWTNPSGASKNDWQHKNHLHFGT